MLSAVPQSWRSLGAMDVEYAERCGICAVGPGAVADIAARCSIVVVELPEHFEAIGDALPRGIDALGWNIGLCCVGEVHSAFA